MKADMSLKAITKIALTSIWRDLYLALATRLTEIKLPVLPHMYMEPIQPCQNKVVGAGQNSTLLF